MWPKLFVSILYNNLFVISLLWLCQDIPESIRWTTWELLPILSCDTDLEANAASTSSSNKIDFSGTWDNFWASAKSVKSASAKFNKEISKSRWPANALMKDVFPQPRRKLKRGKIIQAYYIES